MRKHFLILMLMALLPLAGWAANAEVGTAPAVNTAALTYASGTKYQIVTAGTAATGEIYFAVTSTNSAPAAEAVSTWYTDLTSDDNKKTNAGTYYAWYKVVHSEDTGTDIAPTPIGSVTIAPYDIKVKAIDLGTANAAGATYGNVYADIVTPCYAQDGTNVDDPVGTAGLKVTPSFASWPKNHPVKAYKDGKPDGEEFSIQATVTNPNYTVTVTTATAKIFVQKKPLTVHAVLVDPLKSTITYGDALPEWGITYTNLLDEDNASYTVEPDVEDAPAPKDGVVTGTADWSVKTTGLVNYFAGDGTLNNNTGVVGNADNYQVTVLGLSSANYEIVDATPLVITVSPKAITAAMITKVSATNKVYNGEDQKAVNNENVEDVVVMDGTKKLELGAAKDFTFTTTKVGGGALDADKAIAAGTYQVNVTGIGNYTGTVSKNFDIAKKALVITTKNGENTYDGRNATFTSAKYVIFSNLVDVDKKVNNNGTPDNDADDFLENVPKNEAYAIGKTIADILVKTQVGGVDKPAQNWVDGGYDLVAYSATAANELFKNYNVVYFNGGKYTIKKKALKFTASDKSKNYGETSPLEAADGVTPTAANAATYLGIDGLVIVQDYVKDSKDGTKDEIKTYPTLKVTINEANKKFDEATQKYYYPITVTTTGVKISRMTKAKDAEAAAAWTEGLKTMADNYEITGIEGKFTVNAGTIQVMIQPVTVAYGKESTVVYQLFMNGASAADETAIKNAIKADANAFEIAPTAQDHATKYPNVAVYDLNLNISDALKAQYDGKYTFDVIPSTYEITKATLNITLKAQSLVVDDGVGALKANAHTVELSGMQHGDTAESLYGNIKFAFAGPVAGDTYFAGDPKVLLVAAANYQASATAAKGYFANAITLDPATEFANYKYVLADVTKGNLTVSIAATLALDAEAEDDNLVDAIAAANTKKQNVKFAARTLTKETWNVMVLPFATSVREVSNAFGYAVVDLIDQTKGDENHVYFSIHMGEIPANTPFMVKTDETVDLSTLKNNPADATALVAFLGKTIEAPAADYDGVVGAAGTKFVGVYALTSISGAKQWWLNKAGTDWGYYTSGKAKDIAPTYAYLQLAENADPNAARIFIEEPNGTTTVIKGINAEGQAIAAEGWYTLDGIKLNDAPTQKGIYINNGKKVVLK